MKPKNKQSPAFYYTTLFLMLAAAYPQAWADDTRDAADAEESTELETIRVQGQRRPATLGRTRQNREQLDREMVQDIRDMVRYDPGISVVEGGRAGSNGFAIRGVDKDRVAITVDGLEQGESRSSTAFQELFGAYGNFNTNRNAAELEHMSDVVISKGADSITAGSGALGGAVIYRTKSPRDYVDEEKPYHIGLKTGFMSRSNLWYASGTFAGRLGNFDALAVLTTRHGHETKIHTPGNDGIVKDPRSAWWGPANPYNPSNNDYVGVVRAEPDPQVVDGKGNLFRLGYHFNPNNYLSAVYEETREDRETKELSNLFQDFLGKDYRYRNDISYRNRFGLEYENLLTSGPWDKLNLAWDRQKISMTTFTWDVPVSAQLSSPTAQNFFRHRNLSYDLDQFRLGATKHFDFNNRFSWDLAYGLGAGNKESGNKNLGYWSYVYYPHIATSTIEDKEFLVSARTRSRFAYLNNSFRFGDPVKLNLGVRYDYSKMSTLESDSLQPKVRQELQRVGIWDQSATFKSPSYAAGLEWNVNPALTLQAKYSTAFRAPTTDEMWFYFPSSLFYVDPNPNLKPEHSKNFELGFDAHGNWGHFRLSGFHTRYRDFIDFGPRGVASRKAFGATGDTLVVTYQNFNRTRARVRGLELQSRLNLDAVGLPQGNYATLAASYVKGDAEGEPINAIQPFNGVLGLGYQQPDDRWGLSTQISYFARKNPNDTVADPGSTRGPTFPFARHHRAYWLVDLTGHYRLGRHITLRGGVYNLFNRKYYTWDSIRSIREFGTVNRVDNQTHAGISRFQAPGRNFSVVLEAKF